MTHRCDGCFWRTDFTEGTGIVQYPICEREWWKGFEECKAECEKPGECKFKIEAWLLDAKDFDGFVSYLKENTKRIVEEDFEKARLEDLTANADQT